MPEDIPRDSFGFVVREGKERVFVDETVSMRVSGIVKDIFEWQWRQRSRVASPWTAVVASKVVEQEEHVGWNVEGRRVVRVQDCRVKIPALLEVGCIRSAENAVERFVLHFEQISERETCLERSCDVVREFMSMSVLQRSHFIVNESFEMRRSSMPFIVRPGKEMEMPLPVNVVGWSSGAPPTEL